MASDERSLIEFGYYREGLQRFEYFVLGVTLALCAYVGQTLRPEKLALCSSYTVEVASLLLLVLSAIAGFKRIESLVQLSRLNAQALDAKEKRGEIIKAIPNAQGLIVNEVSGEALTIQAATNWKDQLKAKIDRLAKLLQKERTKASWLYTARNILLLIGFCGLVLSKILVPYLHSGY
jgi:hypothetical protein